MHQVISLKSKNSSSGIHKIIKYCVGYFDSIWVSFQNHYIIVTLQWACMYRKQIFKNLIYFLKVNPFYGNLWVI